MTTSSRTAAIDPEVRLDVADVIVRYGTAIDRRDWALFRSCFTDDCEVDYGNVGAWSGADEFTQFMEKVHAPAGQTLHRMTNVVISRTGEGLSVRSYGDAIVLSDDDKSGTHAAAYYDDDLVQGDDGWRISRRRTTLVLFEPIPDNMAAAM